MKNFAALLLILAWVATGGPTMAQDGSAPGDGGVPPPPDGAPPPGPADGAPAGHTYSRGQLEQMVAPIALYPDSLVSQILIASTYPIQVVEAYQWTQKNKSLTGTRAQEAAKSQGWDPSVQSLVAFPQVLERMYSGLEWTQDLGEAFIAQQQDVLATIQTMRQKAYAAGNLKSTPKQKVVVQESTIVIVPAEPQVVYVPAYNPTVVYGAAWAPATWYYPPVVYAPPPGYYAAAGAVAFGVGVAVGASWASASNCSWSTGSVTVNNNYYRPPAYYGQNGSYHGANGSVAHYGNTTAAYNSNTGQVKTYNSATGETRSGQVYQGANGTAVQGQNGSAAHAGNTTATYNKNTGQVNSYNSATGNTRSGQVNQGANGTTVQGQNGSAAHAGNTTATYNKNTGQMNSYNSATGNSRSAQTYQGANGSAVQGQNGSAAHAGNTTATYNKNTGQANSYNSATGKTRSGEIRTTPTLPAGSTIRRNGKGSPTVAPPSTSSMEAVVRTAPPRGGTEKVVAAAVGDVSRVRPATAAGRAEVVAAVVEVEASAEAAGAEGADYRRIDPVQRMGVPESGGSVMLHTNRMHEQLPRRHRIGVLAAILLFLTLGDGWAAPPSGAKVFKTPQAAVDALLAAAAQKETDDLLVVLGPEGKDVVSSGDETADRAGREALLAAVQEKKVLLVTNKNSVFLKIGPDEWPFPIPIVKGPKGWFFDTAAGKEELISRRIGRNELRTIAACEAFVSAQKEYAHDSSGAYAQKFLSSDGQHDGLYWPAKTGEPQSPLGPLAADAAREGYEAKASASGPKPFHGYFFKILTAQGERAPGGAKNYLADGKMTGGFALVAWPAEYGVSGIMTFIVNQAGIVFEKNLGPTTGDVAKAMDQFNPDLTWKPSKISSKL